MPNFTRSSRNNFANESWSNHWFFKFSIAGLLWLLLYKLFPFDFSQIDRFAFKFIVNEFSQDSLSLSKDFIELFISLFICACLGFGLVGLLRNRGVRASLNLIAILLICGILGTTTEIAQAFLPTRNPNAWDILTDCLGGFLGWLSFYCWRFQIFHFASIAQQKSKRHLFSSPRLATVFVIYFLLAAGMMTLPTASDFRNWNSSFSLMLGNEQTGDRPWQGSIAQVQFFDRALSAEAVAQLFSNRSDRLPQTVQSDALLASYQLTEKRSSYPDRTGQLSELLWKGKPSERLSRDGIMLNSEHWLQTAVPATRLNQKIRQTAELTLDLTVTPASLEQEGPARIISISADPAHRNFTLGQEENDLVIRLRTPATGENGTNPELSIPQVFTDLSSHHVVLTYGKSNLRVYIDNPGNLHSFWLPHPSYKIVYYGAVFVPLGILLGLILSVTAGSLAARIALLFSGAVLPSLLMEGFLAAVNQRSFAPENWLLGQVFMLSMLFVLRKSIVLRIQAQTRGLPAESP